MCAKRIRNEVGKYFENFQFQPLYGFNSLQIFANLLISNKKLKQKSRKNKVADEGERKGQKQGMLNKKGLKN